MIDHLVAMKMRASKRKMGFRPIKKPENRQRKKPRKISESPRSECRTLGTLPCHPGIGGEAADTKAPLEACKVVEWLQDSYTGPKILGITGSSDGPLDLISPVLP